MPNRMISHYRVLRQLGAGGMGEVYLAEDTQLERPVALKVMSAELAADLNQRRRFRTEAKAASGLTHPNICVVHEVGETAEGRPFLAMEYVDGQTLDKVLAQQRPNIRNIISLGIQVAEALEAAHARGMVHRDIKPGNLMLDSRGQVKVMDFGLAKWFSPDTLSASSTSVAHTRTGMLIGTPQYMSPEQALGQALDPRTDIFSLGVVLYEMAAGQRPFLGRTIGETINQIVNQPAAPLVLENPVFSPGLNKIISKCLEKEPGNRYGSASELAADLRRLKENSELALAAISREQVPESATPPRQLSAGPSKRLLWIGAALATIVMLTVGGWAWLHGDESKPAASSPAPNPLQKSVAVLPFVNMSAEKENDYLSDGLSEDLCTALTQVKELRVPARTSCFAFKGKTEDIRRIGEQLHVAAVLEGSVSKSGNKLRINAQLIDVASGFHLWATNYDREMADILEIRSDIARQVVGALRIQLGIDDAERIVKNPTTDIECYKLYLQGRQLWNRRTGASIKQAIEFFNQAIAKDPAYAAAYAGLADCYATLGEHASLPQSEMLPKARAAALKALELNSTLAEPHAVLGSAKAAEWDWNGAEQEFQRAITLKPGYATAHHWYGLLLGARGDRENALAEMKRAHEDDPLSPVITANVAFYLYLNGQHQEGIKMLQDLIEFEPAFPLARNVLGGLYLWEKRPAEAIAQFEAASPLFGSSPYAVLGLGPAYVLAGRTNDAQNILIKLREFQSSGHDVLMAIATLQYHLGDIDGTLDTLEQGLTEHCAGLEGLYVDPTWNDLRQHPKVQAILRKMNLLK